MLIQQARGRGHVTLVVATRSASSLAALSQQQYGGDGAEQAGIKVDYKSSQIPEGVVLRKKKSKSKFVLSMYKNIDRASSLMWHTFEVKP